MKKEESKIKTFHYFFGPQNEQVVKVEYYYLISLIH